MSKIDKKNQNYRLLQKKDDLGGALKKEKLFEKKKSKDYNKVIEPPR